MPLGRSENFSRFCLFPLCPIPCPDQREVQSPEPLRGRLSRSRLIAKPYGDHRKTVLEKQVELVHIAPCSVAAHLAPASGRQEVRETAGGQLVTMYGRAVSLNVHDALRVTAIFL